MKTILQLHVLERFFLNTEEVSEGVRACFFEHTQKSALPIDGKLWIFWKTPQQFLNKGIEF